MDPVLEHPKLQKITKTQKRTHSLIRHYVLLWKSQPKYLKNSFLISMIRFKFRKLKTNSKIKNEFSKNNAASICIGKRSIWYKWCFDTQQNGSFFWNLGPEPPEITTSAPDSLAVIRVLDFRKDVSKLPLKKQCFISDTTFSNTNRSRAVFWKNSFLILLNSVFKFWN